MPEHAFVTAPTGSPAEAPTRHGSGPPTPTASEAGRASQRGDRPSSPAFPATIVVRPWLDPNRDAGRHHPRSAYVERFWLPVLGPSATWLLRRLNDELDRFATRCTGGPDGAGEASDPSVTVDLVSIAQRMGMAYSPGRSSAFARAIQRCIMFDVAHHVPGGLAVRRRIPIVAERHLRRLPPSVATEHDRWTSVKIDRDEHDRADRLAQVMASSGDGADQVEAQLIAVGVSPSLAAGLADALRTDGLRTDPP